MGNEYENQEFRNAAFAAGVSGRDWTGKEAIKHCSKAFHYKFSRFERQTMSFEEMVEWAADWWADNSHKYY